MPTPPDPFARLRSIIARLRAPGGCPWDRKQTHATLRHHLLEETYETLDAIDSGDDAALCEELGDVLMQPLMHAEIADEEGRFDIDDVINGIADKLIRRHPHVFGEVIVQDDGEVLTNWEAIKKLEKADLAANRAAAGQPVEADTPASVLDGVVRTLPALSLALGVSKKAARVGFEWPNVGAVMDKLREETVELENDLHQQGRAAEELGDLLFTAVNIARWQKIDPELALRDTVTRFSARFAAMEAAARASGIELETLTPAQWEEMWRQAKMS